MYINRKTLLPLSYWDDPDNLLTMFSETSDLIYISKSEFIRIPENGSLIFKIFTGRKISQSTKNVTVRIGGYHNDDTKIVYAPQWVVDQINNGVTLNSEESENLNDSSDSSETNSSGSSNYGLKVHLLQIFNAPIATSIKIEVLNPEKLNIYGLACRNVRDIYEEALQNYGGVEFDRTIPLLLKVREDFEVDISVKITQIEPMSINGYVRFDGDVVLDFEEPAPLPEETPFTQEKEPFPVLSREELREARLKFFNKN